MAAPQPATERRYTYEDYLSWDDGRRWELIEGSVFDMSPAPSLHHQRIQRRLLAAMELHLKGQTAEVFGTVADVCLTGDDESGQRIETVVQPDIFVVCDPAKLRDGMRCLGAPDLVVEILSESHAQYDLKTKRVLYEANGVREFWVICPWQHSVAIHRPGPTSKYGPPESFGLNDTIETEIIPGLRLPLSEILA